MANTERLNTLKKTAEARKQAGEAREEPGLTDAQMLMLDATYSELVEAEDTLLKERLRQHIEDLEDHAKNLRALSVRLRRSTEELKVIGKAVNDVATTIGVLADIVAKAASVGIL